MCYLELVNLKWNEGCMRLYRKDYRHESRKVLGWCGLGYGWLKLNLLTWQTRVDHISRELVSISLSLLFIIFEGH